MSVACRSTCRPTIGQHSRSTYRPPYRSSVSRHIDRRSTDMSADISVDISTDTRPICRPTYRWTLGRYVDRSVDMSTDMSVEGCTKYTWSSELTFLKLQVRIFQRVTRLPITQTLKGNWKRFKLLGVGGQITENKEKWRLLYFYSYSLSILMQFNSREVKWKWNDTFSSKLLCKSERTSVTGNTEKKAKQNRNSRSTANFVDFNVWRLPTEFMRFTFSRNSCNVLDWLFWAVT